MGKNCKKRKIVKREKTKNARGSENNQAMRVSSQKKKKKTPTELPKLKCNKLLTTWDSANIV